MKLTKQSEKILDLFENGCNCSGCTERKIEFIRNDKLDNIPEHTPETHYWSLKQKNWKTILS